MGFMLAGFIIGITFIKLAEQYYKPENQILLIRYQAMIWAWYYGW